MCGMLVVAMFPLASGSGLEPVEDTFVGVRNELGIHCFRFFEHASSSANALDKPRVTEFRVGVVARSRSKLVDLSLGLFCRGS